MTVCSSRSRGLHKPLPASSCRRRLVLNGRCTGTGNHPAHFSPLAVNINLTDNQTTVTGTNSMPEGGQWHRSCAAAGFAAHGG